MHSNDLQLTKEDIGQLENVEQIIHFFARLGYNVDDAIPLDHAALSLDSDDLRQQIRYLQRIASDPDEDLIIYFFQVRSVTIALTQTIARRFRERAEDAILVLTTDFESLDFVLLDKELAKGKTRGKVITQIIRPRSLTVNRRNPAPVALRTLKRFTFTEADGVYQWDKLRSAYDVAEWTEPEFNNRALFSDYYLKNRLTEARLTPEWGEDVRPIGRKLHQHLSQARQTYTRQPEETIRAGLYEPLFWELGFEFVINKSGTADTEEPDYLLYSPGDRSQPLAAALTYVWNRNLDDEDTTRDPDTPSEIPGALVVSVLEKSAAPWVIMTNGKLWRLYSTTASNKATNYYEIDLEEALAAPDQITALKYLWLFFRRAAFTGFLDTLLKQSADYAKALGDRLKDRVFTEIFPHFAAGFIHHARVAEVSKPRPTYGETRGLESAATPANVAEVSKPRPTHGETRGLESAATMDDVYQGTLTFLYRLMFVLYAESLELLPLYETRGYRALSLHTLKREIAERAGDILDEAPDKLKQHYTATSTALYDQLTALFTVIDEGSDALNLPTYNGGLFSRTNENGEFLADHKIPDRHLALGLDRLCRDVDEKTQALALIDYKSLGVRQLGSIYEGLLEFKLRIAAEDLIVVKGQYVAANANPTVAADSNPRPTRPTRQRRGLETSATVAKGQVYLENDKKERKATGSYYTPDYIVKYIVAHTVGPVLERKFADLTPRLRQAQRAYHDHVKKVRARGNDQPADLFWNEPPMRQLADDCLNVRVLDPAMGSGHFLVEAVDFISNRLIDFLNGWSDNPVWALLNRTRDDILGEMERQGVTIDVDRLTRVALLKRAVLKRCIYGVDLNLMAVELAKVSLWLDAFTLGAPLSFLDHHLKPGNSLIGARIKEVEEAVEGTAAKAVQLSLFSGGPFTGLSMATDLMRRVSTLSDNTVAQVTESRDAFRDADAHLAYHKRVMDLYTSRWFGNEPTKKLDSAVEFIRNNSTREWLKQLDPDEWLDGLQSRPPEQAQFDACQVAQTASDAAQSKHFFHWELEFPELFFAPSQPGGQDVQLLEDGGFDAVVGNPPYGIEIVDIDKGYYNSFVTAVGKYESYRFFLEICFWLCMPQGEFGMIVPNTWLTIDQAQSLRELMLTNTSLLHLSLLGSWVFADANLEAMLLIARTGNGPTSAKVVRWDEKVHLPISTEEINIERFEQNARKVFDVNTDAFAHSILEKIRNSSIELSTVSSVIQGLVPYRRTTLVKRYGHEEGNRIIDDRAWHADHQRDNTYWRELAGGDVNRYGYDWNEKRWLSYGKWLMSWYPEEYFSGHRLVFQSTRNPSLDPRLVGTYIEENFVHDPGLTIVKCAEKKPQMFLSAYLLSALANWVFKQLYPETLHIYPTHLRPFPVPRIDFITPANEQERLLRKLVGAYTDGDNDLVLREMQVALAANQFDVVHDVLAHLAQTMIDLNKQKQAETKRFLGWLEGRLKIAPKNGAGGLDSLTGKTILQGYLGDYQKGERETSWEDFFYRLHQNRNRFAANLAQLKPQIEQEYEKSLAVLRPIKQQLADTDALIDQIVYQLYGLSDDEIELIERPAYEQALSDAKAKVVKDKELQKDPEAAADAIAQTILPAAQRLQSRVPHQTERERLTQDLPGWETLPGDAPTFLLSGEYDLATRPEQLDFSSAVISFAKAVEQAMMQRLFLPFREQSGYTAADCRNKFLQEFMRGERHLTLGSFPIIMGSSRETALRQFAASQFRDAETALFSDSGILGTLQDAANIALRNKAAHDEVLSKEDAQNGREWALAILRHL